MNTNGVLRHANMQARVRARLGELPGRELWRELVDVPHLAGLLDRLRNSVLSHWVISLSRQPEPLAMERHLADQWRARRRATVRLLPRSSKRLGRWLDLESREPAARSGGSEESELSYAPRAPAAGLHEWNPEWRSIRSEFAGIQAEIVRRLERLWLDHERAIAARRVSGSGPAADPDEQWLLRARLERGLRDLAAGDPFHPALVMILLDLEWIQFERVRALALARIYGWPIPRLF